MRKVDSWPQELVDKINREQFDNNLRHPLTCPHRSGEPATFHRMLSDKKYHLINHEKNGRDLAILEARPEGYLECPFCGYTQHVDVSDFIGNPMPLLKWKEPSLNMDWPNAFPEEEKRENQISYEKAQEIYLETQKNNAAHLGFSVGEYFEQECGFTLTHRNPPEKGFHERSALMMRILEGKDPLEFPPPKNGAFPWYSLIDEPNKSRPVSIGLGGSMPTLLNLSNHSVSNERLTINNNSWLIVSKNQAAEEFQKLQAELWVEKDGEMVRPDGWVEKALIVASNSPEFVVRDRFYGDFRVWYSLDNVIQRNPRHSLYVSSEQVLNSEFSDDLSKLSPVVSTVENTCGLDEIDIPYLSMFGGELSQSDIDTVHRLYGNHKPEMDYDMVSYKCGGWRIQKVSSKSKVSE